MTAILGWGFVGKQVRPSIIASVLFVLSAVVSIVAVLPAGSTVSDEATASKPRPFWERAGPNYGYDPSGPASYNALQVLVPTHPPPAYVPPTSTCACAFACCVPDLRYFGADLEADALEYKTLLASLSPGVRASYDGAVLAQKHAEKREHERDEAEYAAFIEERLRRLNAGRPPKQ